MNLKEKLKVFEKSLIEEELLKNKYRKGNTAKSLGISRKMLFIKIKQHNIDA